MRYAILLALALSVSASADKPRSTYIRDSIMTLCTRDYPDDLVMRAACKRNAERGAHSMNDIRVRYIGNQDMQRSLEGCFNQYTENGATDFAMAGACARNNERGWIELQN